MFSFDQASLPQITTRKAFIGVDFQHDFISNDGALHVHEPDDFVGQTIKLAQAFRDVGEVVWVQSQFVETRPASEEQIVVTNDPPQAPRVSKRGRANLPAQTIDADGPPDEEAFLSHDDAVCVKADTPGCRIASAIEESVPKTDTKLTKSHYSAFQSTHLLRLLRAKMVMELFICGSLTNIGVYATALDAAGHGMAITIVEDCCGYRSESRKTAAIASLIELTGCEIASYDEVMEILQPKPKPPRSRGARKPTSSSKDVEQSRSIKSDPPKDNDREKSTTPDFVEEMTSLRLASNSPSPAPAATQPQPKAPSTSAAEGHDSKVKPQSKAEETNGVNQAAIAETTEAAQEQNSAEESPIKDNAADAIQGETSSQHTAKDEQESTIADPKNITPEDKDQTIEQTELPEKEVHPIHLPLSQSATKHEEQTMETPADKKQETPDINKSTGTYDGHLQQKGLCEGDTDIFENVLPDSLLDGVFDKLREEVQWQRMSHQGGQVPRLVAVQGEVGSDGSIPVYRHPSDESPPLLPLSPTVLAIKTETEKRLGHSLNHVLIQYYRDGHDYISEHSDKTLDIVKGSYIANVSLGAERTMTFRTKRRDKDPSQNGDSSPETSKRMIQRAKLPHNSLCRLGLQSNMKWLHAIRQDKRSKNEKSTAELAYEGGRISLTFRQIGTFLDREETLIWGQGAKAKTIEDAHEVINGQSPEAIEMLKAFGTENHSSEFDWDTHYGKGFDVLHMSNAPRFFACSDPTVNMRIALMLAEFGVNHANGSISTGSQLQTSDNLVVKFMDKDKSTVQGDLAVMLYLDARYGLGKPGSTPQTPKDLATRLTRFQRGMALMDAWRSLPKDDGSGRRDPKSLSQELEAWEGFSTEDEGPFTAGAELSLPDFAFWPVLHAIVEETGIETLQDFKKLQEYHKMMSERPGVKKVLGKQQQQAVVIVDPPCSTGQETDK